MSLLQRLLDSQWDDQIRNHEGSVIATMRPVTPEIALGLMPSSPLVKTLCAWRNQNRACFLDTREMTPNSTAHWLLGLTNSPDRLFFIIYDLELRPLGQYGLRRLDRQVVELDGGILGVRDVAPDLYRRVQMRVLDLSLHSLGFEEARARVLADNIPALFLHRRCGLRRVDILENYSAGRDVWVMAVDLRNLVFS